MGNQGADSKCSAKDNAASFSTHVWRWGLAVMLCYSMVLLACFTWHTHDQKDYVLELARAHARIAWAKDLEYRRWISGHGGVYVPVTEKTPANPYLKVPNREITLPSGQVLTLVNPAYMTRQVHELAKERTGVIGHLTSLKPLRPANAPDAWEAAALKAFESGHAEISGVVEMNGSLCMRVMRPVRTEQSCLKCHGSQGYELGDIRGGISAAVPLEPLLAITNVQFRNLSVGYAVVWVIGLAGIATGTSVIQRRNQERDHAQNELVKARDLAQAAVREKGFFLANMSHEIRTPMTAILGFIDNLLDPSLGERERADCVETIRRNGQHLLQLINDILDTSKIEAGRLETNRVSCDTRQMVHDLVRLFRCKAEEKFLTFSVENDGPIPAKITTDPTRLMQALVNLVANAIKFTSKGSVRVIVGCDVQHEMISFAVADTGIGITPEQMTRLFHPFVQADSSTSRKYGGTGLGLTITKRIAELLGGDVVVSSHEGEGSTFTLTIATGPLEGVQMVGPADLGPTAKPDVQPTAVPPYRLGGRVLLAEDGPDNQRLVSLLLQRAGVEVVVVDNGKRAVEAALTAAKSVEPFDVILMDVQMPEMDGYEATRALREQGYNRPIIALTAHAMKSDLDDCLQAGCNDYLSKPISRDLLLRTLAAQMDRSRTTTAAVV